MSHKQKSLIVIAGPTAIGKTELAIKLANFFSTEIVSADSRQFFKEMAIGTAKPTPEELDRAVHHFVDFLPVDQFFSAGDFEKAALQTLQAIFEKNNFAILVGGSGLYVRAVCEGFDSFPEIPVSIREELNLELENDGLQSLVDRLKVIDPVYAAAVDQANPQRVIRALEVSIYTGKPFSSFKTQTVKERDFNIIKIGLNISREELYDRINRRVDLMVQNGLVEEARALLDRKDLNALQTVGYSELFDHFDGNTNLDEAVNLIKQNTRRYAKRQLTWFKKEEGIRWFEPGEFEEIVKYIKNSSSESGIQY